MNFNLKDIENVHAQALFISGDSVTIQLFDKEGTDVTPSLSADAICTEFGTSGIFQWPYANLDALPGEYEEYTWTMTNQIDIKQIDVDSFASYPDTLFSVPFDVDISTLAINKGDSFEPEIRIDTNSIDLNVAVLFSDGETTDSTNIYKATSDIADRGDGLPGGDDQVKLVAQGDTFQIFRIFLSDDETVLFDSRHVDMKITAETKDGKTQTTKKKIPFSQNPAINFDLVP